VFTLGGNSSILISERVILGMRVQERLGFLVTDLDSIVIVDADATQRQRVVCQSLLERWGHEVVAGPALVQDGEVDLEPEKVEDERNYDQPESSGHEMLSKTLERQSAPDIQQVPEIDSHRSANSYKGEDTHVFRGNDAGQSDSSEEQPLPPLASEGLMAELVESNVAEKGASHGEDQGGIKEYQPGLSNVGVVYPASASACATAAGEIYRKE
jgi:hypothetical protein